MPYGDGHVFELSGPYFFFWDADIQTFQSFGVFALVSESVFD